MYKHKYDVRIDSVINDKMYSHIRFLAQVSISAANRLYCSLEAAIESLRDCPYSCPKYTPKKPIDAELRYKLCANRYRIIFEIVENFVYVYDIQDCRQDTDKNLI